MKTTKLSEYDQSVKDFFQREFSSPKRAKKLLQDAGILTASGRIASPYRAKPATKGK